MPKIWRGFTIRLHRSGDPVYADQKIDTWALKGQLPVEWSQIQSDPTVDDAELYPSSQRHIRADRRHVIARHGK